MSRNSEWRGQEESSHRLLDLAAGAWGLAEATFFFFVPDVLLSWVALRDPRRALIGCLWALAGAMAGGLLMYGFGASDASLAENLLDRIPAIHPQTLERVEGELAERGMLAVFLGPLSGTPYKIYAVEAGKRRDSLTAFLAVTIPARLLRFVLVSLLAAGVARRLRRTRPTNKKLLHLAVWTTFYTFYFWNLGL